MMFPSKYGKPGEGENPINKHVRKAEGIKADKISSSNTHGAGCCVYTKLKTSST